MCAFNNTTQFITEEFTLSVMICIIRRVNDLVQEPISSVPYVAMKQKLKFRDVHKSTGTWPWHNLQHKLALEMQIYWGLIRKNSSIFIFIFLKTSKGFKYLKVCKIHQILQNQIHKTVQLLQT